jgi:hypothetical protein
LGSPWHCWLDSRIDAKTSERLRRIEEAATKNSEKLDLIYDLWKDQIKRAASLKPVDFSRQLPQIAESLKVATALRINVPVDVQGSIQAKFLQADSRAPGYWPAAQYIAYRSEQQAARRALYLFKPQPYGLPPEQCNQQIPAAIQKIGEPKKDLLPANLELCVFDLTEIFHRGG